MNKIKAYSLSQAKNIFIENKYKVIELCFDMSCDDFFIFSEQWCEKGVEVFKEENFILKFIATSTD